MEANKIEPSELPETNEPASEKIRIEYVKSNMFRVVHPDGAFGGTTPRLELFIDFYTERFPIPRVLVYEAFPSGGVPANEVVVERESKEGVIRESEVGIVLDLPVAKVFAEWLNGKVAELEKARIELSEIHQKKDSR